MGDDSQSFFADDGNWFMYNVVGSGVAGFNLGFRASRILCLNLDSFRTGAFGNEVDVV